MLTFLGLLECVMMEVKLVHDVVYNNNENTMQDILIYVLNQ
jgi:hypothetical protein